MRPANPDFSGQFYDWRLLVERSRRYPDPGYKLFRAVCPSWDSEPRRPGAGSVFLHSTPEGYREWLGNAIVDTRARLAANERLIFINAWNEWAEGAHLEPDQRYGYAWLKATRDALLAQPAAVSARRVAVVTHDAYLHGAQHLALHIVKGLSAWLDCTVEVVCLGDGPLKSEFAKYATLHDLAGVDPRGPQARELAAKLFHSGFQHAIVNTTVSGLFLATLKEAGLRCVSLIHELPELIRGYQLQAHAESVAQHADCVVFAAEEVRDAFAAFANIPPGKTVIQPQGLYKRNRYASTDLLDARRVLRETLGLAPESRIVLGVGYADHRKGVDYFVHSALHLVEQDPSVYFVWVGQWELQMQSQLAPVLAQHPELSRNIHFVGWRDDTDFYYAGADVFALTSREDPYPAVMQEALSVGLPVVAFQGSGGANRLLDEGAGVNVPMGDTQAFARAVQWILNDEEARLRLARRAVALVAERFSFRRYLFHLLKFAGVALHRVSVVVPNYNYERYLEGRFTSILAQTYPIYELIFLDDASLDNSMQAARAILAGADIEPVILSNPVNSGSVFDQWKQGVDLARGDIVWIAEADDLCAPAFLATVLAGFEDPSVVLSYCESRQIDPGSRVLGENHHEYLADLGVDHWKNSYVACAGDEIRNYMAVKNTIVNASAVLMKRAELGRVLREYIAEIRLYRVAGDWFTYLHLLADAKLAYFAPPLNSHRRHRHAVTAGSLKDSFYLETAGVQSWVSAHYTLSPRVVELARRHLDDLAAAIQTRGVASEAREPHTREQAIGSG